MRVTLLTLRVAQSQAQRNVQEVMLLLFEMQPMQLIAGF